MTGLGEGGPIGFRRDGRTADQLMNGPRDFSIQTTVAGTALVAPGSPESLP
jgi:hypothetical protein